MIHDYLKWNEKIIADFSDDNINSLYNEGYVFTRIGKGIMNQTRSLRIDLAFFKLSSENRRVLKKNEGLDLNIEAIPYKNYSWEIGKLAKDFYDTKFGAGVFSANKIKEILTDKQKNNFNTLFVYSLPLQGGVGKGTLIPTSRREGGQAGYAICYANNKIVHYSYPFYNLKPTTHNLIPNLGMGMMIMAIMAAKQNGMQYIYLGSAQRPKDIYKLQFSGLEWFGGNCWNTDLKKLKQQLKNL